MFEPGTSPEEISAWKAQQEANRAARLRQLHSPTEIWQQQQVGLDALAKLRPDNCRKRSRPTANTPPGGSAS